MQRHRPISAASPRQAIAAAHDTVRKHCGIAADFFDLAGVHGVTVDRLLGWLDVTRAASGTAGAGAKGLIACLRLLFADKGVPEILSSDGGTEFTSAETQAFLKTWQVKHRLSSAHFPQSNGRAEVAVKSAKRLLRDHCLPSGQLDTDEYLLAIMAHGNTIDPETKIYGDLRPTTH